MNETLFECTYTDSQEMLRESYANVRCRWNVRVGWLLIFLAAFLFMMPNYLTPVTQLVLEIIFLAYGINKVCLPTIYAHRVMKQIKQANGGVVPSAKIIVTDKIVHYYKQDIAVTLFEDLRYVYFLKKCIVVVSDESICTFERAGFTKGSAEEFENFIREKCPHVKIINKK